MKLISKNIDILISKINVISELYYFRYLNAKTILCVCSCITNSWIDIMALCCIFLHLLYMSEFLASDVERDSSQSSQPLAQQTQLDLGGRGLSLMGINSHCVYYVVRPQYVVHSDPVFSDMLKVNMSMFPLRLWLNVLRKPREAGDGGLYYLCWRSSVFYWDKQQLYLDPPCSLEIKWMSPSFSVLTRRDLCGSVEPPTKVFEQTWPSETPFPECSAHHLAC